MLFSDEVEHLHRLRKSVDCKFNDMAAEAKKCCGENIGHYARLSGMLEFSVEWLVDKLLEHLHKDEWEALDKLDIAERRCGEVAREAARQAMNDDSGVLGGGL